ncbi:Hypothetical protein PHPALM_37650 [Phytophthora palmivora]|uniref:Uncharacterized protein n=1 Tax=Phytophthora palmivora TaxID=4796 RepID=A0A2P4WWV8_9STRA|nr:Hypothetical protein PHPALM_37650 [Phytophthora palmivora]
MIVHPAKFGEDPTYAELFDGSYGPSDSVLAVAEDPLALLFYFMPPKLWSQIAIESNRYPSSPCSSRGNQGVGSAKSDWIVGRSHAFAHQERNSSTLVHEESGG